VYKAVSDTLCYLTNFSLWHCVVCVTCLPFGLFAPFTCSLFLSQVLVWWRWDCWWHIDPRMLLIPRTRIICYSHPVLPLLCFSRSWLGFCPPAFRVFWPPPMAPIGLLLWQAKFLAPIHLKCNRYIQHLHAREHIICRSRGLRGIRPR
jgi:hypothetical protein